MKLTTLVSIVLIANTNTGYTNQNYEIQNIQNEISYIDYFEDLIPEGATVVDATNQNYVEYVEHRNGENIVLYEVHEVPENMEANGINYEGEEVQPGDKVLTVFIYNPETNYTDDILERYDFVLEKGE